MPAKGVIIDHQERLSIARGALLEPIRWVFLKAACIDGTMILELYRFFVPDLARGAVVLPEDQAHHAAHVLRLVAGTPVILFNGQGAWAQGTLQMAGKKISAVAQDIQVDPPPRIGLTLASAMPKADRADWLIEQASQLNVSTLQWLDTQRGVVKPKESGNKIEKHRRLAIESAKQCGRTQVLAIETMKPLGAVVGLYPVILWTDPRAAMSASQALEPLASAFAAATVEKPMILAALIGPEGGWSDEEIALLEKARNVVRMKLTPTILRIETAAAAIAALLGCR